MIQCKVENCQQLSVCSYFLDVRKTLESQYEDIVALRTQMLNEYEQLLSVRTEVMASQTQEVEKLQQEMAAIQRQYEEQMTTFQAKVEAQTGMFHVVMVVRGC